MDAGRKKFVVKPFRNNIGMDVNKAKETWQSLRSAIGEIHGHNASLLSFEELYRNSYNMVLHKHGDMLYSGVVECITEHLVQMADRVIKATDDTLMTQLFAAWTDHTITMTMIRDILMYMDRTYVSQKRKMLIYDMGLVLFLESIARHPQVKDRLKWHLLANIDLERNGELIDRGVMKDILGMLVDLGVRSNSVYEEDFENEFLSTTAAFYNAEAQRLLDQNTCPDFMEKADRRLTEEHHRVMQYLNSSTELKLKAIVERELIANHAKALVDMEGSGCVAMFRDDKVADLRRMYVLFKRVPATLDDIGTAVTTYIKTTGLDLVQAQLNLQQTQSSSTESALQFVNALLTLQDKFMGFLTSCWADDKAFHKCIQRGSVYFLFEAFMNTSRLCAYTLAQYVDDLLKSKSRFEADLERQADKVVGLFRYLSDKDVFEEFYKRFLAKRLLHAKGSTDEGEKMVIAKLKAECGYQFTSKLEGMFKDMAMTKDLMDGFKKVNPLLSVQVLTMGYWPTETSTAASHLPPGVRSWVQRFETFYFGRHNGRKLTWLHNMGSADIKATFGHGDTMVRHELTVSTFQMCILMLFNERPTWVFREIQEKTGIDPVDLRRHLISLCTPKFRIVLKSSKGKTIEDDDVFTINHEYKSKLHKVRIPLVSVKDSPGSAESMAAPPTELPPTVEEDRKHLVEAAIVRIMKTRKSMQHNNLMTEVTRQLTTRFVPSPQMIKRRIESLIEREYLTRNQSDRRLYNYTNMVLTEGYSQVDGGGGRKPFLRRKVLEDEASPETNGDGLGKECVRHTVVDGEVCAICREDMVEAQHNLTYCKRGCGNNFHIDCSIRKQAKENIICPLCRHDWGDSALSELKKEADVSNRNPLTHKASAPSKGKMDKGSGRRTLPRVNNQLEPDLVLSGGLHLGPIQPNQQKEERAVASKPHHRPLKPPTIPHHPCPTPDLSSLEASFVLGNSSAYPLRLNPLQKVPQTAPSARLAQADITHQQDRTQSSERKRQHVQAVHSRRQNQTNQSASGRLVLPELTVGRSGGPVLNLADVNRPTIDKGLQVKKAE
ncbi:hypothetical protein DYB26_000762, partial [Aphanomyces astaci]